MNTLPDNDKKTRVFVEALDCLQENGPAQTLACFLTTLGEALERLWRGSGEALERLWRTQRPLGREQQKGAAGGSSRREHPKGEEEKQ